ncbi:MAG: efflux RND transporter periplasmic adaptor subunit [Gemmataceae bacterium]
MSDHAVMEPPVLESAFSSSSSSPPPAATRRNPIRAFLGFVFGSIPTLLVLAGLGAVGWWGNHYGWSLPKFSELKGEIKPKDDWCSEHNVPESECVECDESLLPKPADRGWCKLHGVPECVLCNPSLAEVTITPVVTSADLDRAKRALDFTSRVSNTSNCRTHQRRIQFATAADADKAGITVEPVWTSPAVEFVSGPGELGYDQTKVAHLSSRSSGTVWKVFKHIGQDVNAGDVLALVDSAEVGKAKAELLQALAALQLKEKTFANIKESSGSIPAVRYREAEAAVRDAEIRVGAGCQALTNLGLAIKAVDVRALNLEQLQSRLHLLGIPGEIAATLENTATTNLLPIVTPLAGRVVSREVVAGEVVDTNRILFQVVDTRSLWLTLDVKGEDAHRVRMGQTVRFRPDNGREELTGTITWRSTQADPKTRTVKIRADIADPGQALVSNTFGSGRVILREEEKVISVPNNAVQFEGCCHVVFIRDRNYLKSDYKLFHVRKVRIGAKDEKNTEIIAGVLPGELVVTKGSGLLLTELLRGNLGEGCACHSKN